MTSSPPDSPPGTPSDDGEPGGLLRPQIQAVLRSGLLDMEYYQAASGEVFGDRRAAARHLVAGGMAEGLSPTPLLSVEHLPKPVAKAWRKGQIRRSLELLADPEHARSVLGPLFDGGVYLDSLAPGTDLDGLSPLGHFLSHADAGTALPVPPGCGRAPRLGDAREALTDHASLVAAQEHDRSGRELSFHDSGPDSGPVPSARPARLWEHSPGGPLITILAPWADNPLARSTAILLAQEQTLHRWELVFCGPGVPEGDGAVLPAGHVDGRVRAARCGPEEDWRNRGLVEAEAPYAAFLSPGHWWRPDYLEAALKRLVGTGRESGYAAVLLHDLHGRAAVQASHGDLATLRSGGRVDLGALVCRTSAAREAGGFDPGLGEGADVDFAIRLADRGPTDTFPFIASERLTTSAVAQPSTAAGANGDWLTVLGRAWVDWDSVRAGLADRVPGRVSVVVPTYRDAAMTIHAVRSLLETTSVPDVEVNIVDNGSSLSVGQDLIAAFLGDPRVRYRRLPVNLNFAIACNVGFAQATGAQVLFLNNDTVSGEDWLPAVVAHLDDDTVAGAQPVLLYPDRTVQAAGSLFPAPDSLACHFLTGLEIEDARAAAGMRFSAITAAAMLMRAEDVAELEGFDAHYVNGMEDVDLCLRALRLRPGGFRVEPSALLIHLEGKTAGRGHRIPQNRDFFMERWRGRLPEPELDKYERAGFHVERIEYDDVAVPSPRPVITRA